MGELGTLRKPSKGIFRGILPTKNQQDKDFLETFPVSWALERQLKAYLKQTVKRVSLPNKRASNRAFFGGASPEVPEKLNPKP